MLPFPSVSSLEKAPEQVAIGLTRRVDVLIRESFGNV